MSNSPQKNISDSAFVLWFTGLSGSGKTTLSRAVAKQLYQKRYPVVILDGDDMRQGVCQDLGFSNTDRKENIRRIAELSKLLVAQGNIVLSALISPFVLDRQKAREIIGSNRFVEIYCHCPFEVCENRDIKSLYQDAKAGNITDFTGIDSAYEAPKKADIVVNTATQSIAKSVQQVLDELENGSFIS